MASGQPVAAQSRMAFIPARISVLGGRPLATPRDQRCRPAPNRLDAVVSSDLAPAWTAARIVAEGLGVPLIREPGLRGAHIGEAEGLFYAPALSVGTVVPIDASRS